jgi:hypothetical protein
MCGEGIRASTDTGALEAAYRPPHEGWTPGPGLHRVIAWERGPPFRLPRSLVANGLRRSPSGDQLKFDDLLRLHVPIGDRNRLRAFGRNSSFYS